MKGTKFVIITIGVLILSLALRVKILDKFAFWGDEVLTIQVINGISDKPLDKKIFTNKDLVLERNLSNTISNLIEKDGGNGLFYYLTLHFWSKLFGNSPFAIRLFSAIFSLFIVILIIVFSYRLFKNYYICLVVLSLISIHPLFFAYSAEARSYEMATFFSLLSSYYIYLIFEQKEEETLLNWNYILYGLTVLISLFSHYFTIYIFIAHFFIIIFVIKNKRKLYSMFFIYAFILFILLLWMVVGGYEGYKNMASHSKVYLRLAIEYEETKTGWVLPASMKYIIISLYNTFFYILGTIVGHTRFLLALLVLSVSAMFYIIFFKKEILNNSLNAVYFLAIFPTVYIIFIISLALKEGHCLSFITRYANFVVPYFAILLAYGIYVLLRNRVIAVRVFGVTLLSIILIDQGLAYDQIKSGLFITNSKRGFNYYETARQIIEKYNNMDTVFYYDWYTARMVNLYLVDNKELMQAVDTLIQSRNIIIRNGLEYKNIK